MIHVSVIVPIHNAGKYLNDCLNALHEQTMQEMEFVLVLDCPTDGSDVVAKRYAQSDSRFVIVENDMNLHIGPSRNKGIDKAKGTYLAFCDHDDIMEPDMYQLLYNEAVSYHADIVISRPAIMQQGQKIPWEINATTKPQILSDLLSSGGSKQNISHLCNIHNVLYRAILIQEHAIRFVNTKTNTPEDVFFNIETIYAAQTVYIFPQALYYHRIIEDSAGHQSQYLSWRNRFNGLQYIYDWLISRRLYDSMQTDFSLMVQKKISDGLLSIIVHKGSYEEFQTAYRQARHYPFTQTAFRNYRDEQPRPLIKKIIRRILAFCLAL